MSEQVTDEMVDVAERLIYDDEPQWKHVRALDGYELREPKTFEECYGCAPHEHEEGKLMRLALEAALPLSPLSRRVEELEAGLLESTTLLAKATFGDGFARDEWLELRDRKSRVLARASALLKYGAPR